MALVLKNPTSPIRRAYSLTIALATSTLNTHEMASDMVVAFLAALQASASVLLTIWYGILAAQARFLDSNAAKQLSRLGVSMLLPALLMTNIGSQLEPSTVTRYIPILIWALAYNLVSLAIGIVCTRLFSLPKWVTPAIAFNNTTSLPLLLIQALGSTGAITQLLRSDDDSVSDAVDRARSYLLVASIIGNSLTFGFGGELLGAHEEDPRDEFEQTLRDGSSSDDETDQDGNQMEPDEESSLLPTAVTRYKNRVSHSGYSAAIKVWDVLPAWAQTVTARVARFMSPPVFGAVVGTVIGLVPALNRVFFNDPDDGGIFKAWLTSSVKNLGEMFVTLQVIVVGVKLAIGLRGTSSGESTGRLPAPSVLLVLGMRFVVWPV